MLISSSLEGNWSAEIKLVSLKWRDAIKEQNEIGWEQLYRVNDTGYK
jgi:hypothetical protein